MLWKTLKKQGNGSGFGFKTVLGDFIVMLDLIIAIVRIILGLFLVLFLPGYLFQRALFEEKNDFLEQLALSVGLSICLNVLSVMAMNLWLKIPINFWTVIADILLVCALSFGLGEIKKRIKIGWEELFESARAEPRLVFEKRPFSFNKLQVLSIVLLLGAFLYLFELFSHGFELHDISGVNILLTFFAFVLFALLLFALQYFKGRLQNIELLEFFSFFVFAIVFFYIIFFLRVVNSTVSFLIAFVYFGLAVYLAFVEGNSLQEFIKQRFHLDNPFIRFSFRFFLVLGFLILPASILEFLLSGTIDFRFHGISMLLIQIITPMVQVLLSLFGVVSTVSEVEGGLTLATTIPHQFSVFIGLLCSGITSMSVFLAAFIAMAWDLNTSNARKAIIFAIGIFGTVFSNVLRVTVLVLVGLFFGNDMMLIMHTNLGWVLYFIWMALFWVLAFKIAK